MENTVYDIVGIGIGPFNLGMAALADQLPELKCLFIDENESFNWHPGLMLDTARLQVPFYADLVTLADPCSKYSYLAFLKAKRRMFRFAILENNFITRKEYNEYCQWVAGQLGSLRFGFRCESIEYNENEKIYTVTATDSKSQTSVKFLAKHLVIGIGSSPYVPPIAGPLLNPPHKGEDLRSVGSFDSAPDCDKSSAGMRNDKPLVFHSSDYLYFKELLLTKKSITIIGSGQSAAEIFYDLLTSPAFAEATAGKPPRALSWFTRNDSFYPMDYSRFNLEKTSPDFIDHFYQLSPEVKKRSLPLQDKFYKGINSSLIDDIYNELYHLSLKLESIPVALHSNCELKELVVMQDSVSLNFYHSDLDQNFSNNADVVILATGYQNRVPEFVQLVKERIQWSNDVSTLRHYKVNRNYSIDRENSLFVQNAELHTHGFVAPDLGMGPYRNAIILNSILGYERFPMETSVTFQKFGIPA